MHYRNVTRISLQYGVITQLEKCLIAGASKDEVKRRIMADGQIRALICDMLDLIENRVDEMVSGKEVDDLEDEVSPPTKNKAVSVCSGCAWRLPEEGGCLNDECQFFDGASPLLQGSKTSVIDLPNEEVLEAT